MPEDSNYPADTNRAVSTDWSTLADRVLAGHRLTLDEGVAILQSPDTELLELLSAAYRIRRHYFSNKVRLYFLINAKSGHCGEDCGYCSQSKRSTAPISKYSILDRDQLLDGARMAAERKARTYCIVISGGVPSEREMEAVERIVPEIKERYPPERLRQPRHDFARAGRQTQSMRRPIASITI